MHFLENGFRLNLTVEIYIFALTSDHVIKKWNQKLVLARFEHQVVHKEMLPFSGVTRNWGGGGGQR